MANLALLEARAASLAALVVDGVVDLTPSGLEPRAVRTVIDFVHSDRPIERTDVPPLLAILHAADYCGTAALNEEVVSTLRDRVAGADPETLLAIANESRQADDLYAATAAQFADRSQRAPRNGRLAVPGRDDAESRGLWWRTIRKFRLAEIAAQNADLARIVAATFDKVTTQNAQLFEKTSRSPLTTRSSDQNGLDLNTFTHDVVVVVVIVNSRHVVDYRHGSFAIFDVLLDDDLASPVFFSKKSFSSTLIPQL